MRPATKLRWRAKRHDAGEYEYRGFTIVDHGEGRSVHARAQRSGMSRWKVRRKTGAGYFDSEGFPMLNRTTLKEAKAAIDRHLLRTEIEARALLAKLEE